MIDISHLKPWAGIAGRGGIKPGVWYSLDENGLPVGEEEA